MKNFATLYGIYNAPIIIVLRIILFLLLFFLLFDAFLAHQNFHLSLFFLAVFMMDEVFFHFKIAKTKPKVSLDANTGDVLESCTLHAAVCLLEKNGIPIAKKLLKEVSIQFMIEKCDMSIKELQFIDVSYEELTRQSFLLAKKVGGTFVTTMDIFAAYVVLSESQTKLLFSKQLKDEDLRHILSWARFDFKHEEAALPTRVTFWGQGIGEGWVYGWTLETDKYTDDLTQIVLSDAVVPALIGRGDEYKKAVEVLSQKEKNSLLLVGDPGGGKTQLIRKIAFESFLGTLGGKLSYVRFLELLVGRFLAGASDQGVLETRLQAVLEEISHAGNVILFIPDFENIVGKTTFHIDLSGALLPYLRNGRLTVVATITKANFRNFVEQNPSILEVFTTVSLEEPEKSLALQMLLEKANSIEKKYHVALSYKAIVAAVSYAPRYLNDAVLPGSAVSLLTASVTTASLAKRKMINEADVIAEVEQKTKIPLSRPNAQEKDSLLHLEETMHRQLVDQEVAVSLIAKAIRRIRSGLASQNRPISFLFLGPTGVGKTETAKTLASVYFGHPDSVIRLDMSEYTTEESAKRMLGSLTGENSTEYGDGSFIEKIHDNPSSLVLLDEFEKAHPKILDLFLQVLDDGRLTDNKGRTVSFVNAIIIATSNAASEFIREEIQKGTPVDQSFQKQLLELLQTKTLFRPELLNRFDEVVVFKPLGEEEILAIAKLLLADVSKKLQEQDVIVSFDQNVLEKVAKDGSDIQFGARPLRRYIQDSIEDLLSQKILKDEIRRGDNISLHVDQSGNFSIEKLSSSR